MKMKQLVEKSTMAVRKHSPAIFTTVGIVGLGATAYLAYKSRDKVEAIIEEVEYKREREIEINKLEVARDLTEALYIPICVGAVSVASIFMSYRIQNNRIATLAGALVAQQARSQYYQAKYRKEHGEEAYAKFMAPTEEVETFEEDKNGKKKRVVNDIKGDLDKTLGQWYDESSEYVSDDHTYNMAFIESVSEHLQTILFQRGSLLLNEVREALGFERIRAGMLLGWTTSDNFDITKAVTNILDEATGEKKEQIWVSWTSPRYIFEEVDFTGRYSPFEF